MHWGACKAGPNSGHKRAGTAKKGGKWSLSPVIRNAAQSGPMRKGARQQEQEVGVSASLYFIGCGRSSSHVPQTMPKHGRDRSVVFTQHWRARGMGRGAGDCWGRFQRCRGWLLVTTTLVGGAEGSDAVW